jgi:8-amino-7-oxononanoate synthase
MPSDPLAWIDEELQVLQDQGLRRRLSVREGAQSPLIRLNGREFLSFGSNDYLGLAAEVMGPDSLRGLGDVGWGSGASPLVTGRGRWHAALETRLAEFEATEAALLFPSGYAANVGTLCALAGARDAVFSDAKNHASIVDGCRLSRAQVHIYRHLDMDHLAQLLAEAASFRRKLIVTDSLFSMDGDCAPLAELADLAEHSGAMLMIDEAHATGVFGENGRGLAEQMGVEHRVPIRIGTLSKALGSIGGFVAGSRRLVDWLIQRARSYVYSTAPPEAFASAGINALQIVRQEPWRRRQLQTRAALLRQRLAHDGWNVGASSSQIIPLIIGEPERTMLLSHQLRERGVLVPGIRPPTVPVGESLLRISLTYRHTDEMVDRLVESLGNCR